MHVRNNFVLISKDASVDERDGMVSIFKVIDTFNFELDTKQYEQFKNESGKSIAILPANYCITSSWILDEEIKKSFPIDILVEVTDPDGKKLGGTKESSSFPVGSDKLRLTGLADTLPVTKNGRYTITMTLVEAGTSKKLASADTQMNVSVSAANNNQDV